jgi:hypothetical protein
MKDIVSILKATESKGREVISHVLGPTADYQEVSNAAQDLLPGPVRELQELSKFFEEEMLRCRNAGAYFSGCLAGAAMIESFLLCFCLLEKAAVEGTKSFRSFNVKKKRPYEQTVFHWTLKELIPLTEELEWIGPKVVDQDLVTALVDGYYEIIPVAMPDVTKESLEALTSSIKRRPDVALLVLMQSMRNLVHGGRCIRLKKRLASSDFSDWAKLVLVVTVEIRDCLILRLHSIYQRYFEDLANSPEGVAKFIKLLAQLKATRAPEPPGAEGQ